tara:strand:+ start:6906 stop:7649 length:744 start_codon:yes stop_codon:yes gene_type:complete
LIRAAAFLLITLGLAACSADDPSSNWARGQTGTVSRVIDGDSFVLDDGLVVRLVSIEAPSFGYSGDEDDPYAEESKRALERLVLGRRVELFYPGLTQDRYERALAQVYGFNEAGSRFWVNKELASSGNAWVRLYPDTSAGSDALWTSEADARANSIGLWGDASPESSVIDAESVDGDFVILTGRLLDGTEYETDCVHRLVGSDISVRYRALAGCDVIPEGEVEIRGWARNGTVSAGYHANIRPLPET